MLACSFTRNGQDGTVYLDQAEKFLAEPELARSGTISPIYMDYGKSGLILDMAVVYTQQGNSTKALETLAHLVDPETLTLKYDRSEIARIETINTMTMASLRSKDKNMEQTIHFWTGGIQAARAIHSEQRFREALTAYDTMLALWPDEKRIQELRDLTEHW